MLPILIVVALAALISTNLLIKRSKTRRYKVLPAPRIAPSTMRATTAVWEEVADRRGLTVDEGGNLGMRGDVDGIPIEVELTERNERVSTIVKGHRIPEKPTQLWVLPRGLATKWLASLKGGAAAPAGDPEFDDAFVAGPAKGQTLSGDDRRSFVGLSARKPELAFDGSTATLLLDGIELVHENLEEAIDLVVRITRSRD